jgi:hypothetical protein
MFPVVVLLMDEEEISSLLGIPGAVLLWWSFTALMGALGLLES